MILNYLSIYKISPSELSYPVYLDMERPELSTTTNELVVDGKNGFVVPFGDIKAMAAKFVELFTHPDELQQMSDKQN